MVSFQLRGQAELKRKGERVIQSIDSSIMGSLSDGADILKKKAIENVWNLNKGYVGQSIQGGKITADSSWLVSPIDENKINLTCLSEHAAIVELGAPGRSLYASDYGHKYWPILRQQGIEPEVFKGRITLQEPKHFLGNAMVSETDMILKKIGDHIRLAMESTL